MALPDVCVVYILREHAHGADVLLGYKRTPHGLGRVVGIGGGVEDGESVRDAAVREVREETGLLIEADLLDQAGVLDYRYHPAGSQRFHVFVYRAAVGDAVETDEIVPAWFDIDRVPFERMWDDTRRWLPGVLRGGTVSGTYTFGADLATVVAEAPAV